MYRCADPVRAQDEAIQLTGGMGVGSAAAALKLLSGHCAVAAVTLGARGCLVRGRGGTAFLEPAVAGVAVVDATGERSRGFQAKGARASSELCCDQQCSRAFSVSRPGFWGNVLTHILPVSHAHLSVVRVRVSARSGWRKSGTCADNCWCACATRHCCGRPDCGQSASRLLLAVLDVWLWVRHPPPPYMHTPSQPDASSDARAMRPPGAGDLFAAGFLAALVAGRPLRDCARLGCLAGAAVLQARPPSGTRPDCSWLS